MRVDPPWLFVLLVGQGRRGALACVDVYRTEASLRRDLRDLWHLDDAGVEALMQDDSYERRWISHRRSVQQVFQIHRRTPI